MTPYFILYNHLPPPKVGGIFIKHLLRTKAPPLPGQMANQNNGGALVGQTISYDVELLLPEQFLIKCCFVIFLCVPHN